MSERQQNPREQYGGVNFALMSAMFKSARSASRERDVCFFRHRGHGGGSDDDDDVVKANSDKF